MRQYFCLEAVTTDSFLLSKSSVYYIPEDTDIGGYRDYINVVLPSTDDSEAFGQHPNADISSQVRAATILMNSILFSLNLYSFCSYLFLFRWRRPTSY